MFRSKTISQRFFLKLCHSVSFTRAIRLNPNAIRGKKKGKKLASNRLQTYSTLDGFAIAMDGRSYFGWVLRLVAIQRELPPSGELTAVSLSSEGIHSTREIAAVAAAVLKTERSATILLHGTKTQ